MKEWLFKEKKKGKTDAEIQARLKNEVKLYRMEESKLIRDVDKQDLLAKKMLQAGNRTGARQALSRKTMMLNKINQINNTILNLEQMLTNIDTVTRTASTTEAIKKGVDVIGKTMEDVSVEDTARTMAEMSAAGEKVSMMTEELSDISGLESDMDEEMDDALEAQLAAMEAEMSTGGRIEMPTSHDPLPDTPMSEDRTEEDELEKELAALKKTIREK